MASTDMWIGGMGWVVGIAIDEISWAAQITEFQVCYSAKAATCNGPVFIVRVK